MPSFLNCSLDTGLGQTMNVFTRIPITKQVVGTVFDQSGPADVN